MAELIAIIGLTANILNLIEGVTKALGFVESLRKAPEEIASLQHELANFKKAIQDIAAFQGDRALLNSIVGTELSRCRDVIQKIHTFIDNSLLRNGQPSFRKWAKKSGRMKQLREDLRVGRNQLILGLIVSNSAYSSKAAAQLDTITHQLSVSQSSTQIIEKSLHQLCSQNSSFQETILRAANVSSETKEMVLSTISNARKSWEPEEKKFSAAVVAGNDGNRSLTGSRDDKKEHIVRDALQSPTYFPAQYTSSTRVDRVRVLAMFEKSCSSVERVNEFHVIFPYSPQRWLSIVLSVSTQRSSLYWSPLKVSKSRSVIGAFIPKFLERKLVEVLLKMDNPGDSMELCIELSGNASEKWIADITQISYTPGRQLLDFARDLVCPVYPEEKMSPLYNYGNPRGSTAIAALVSGLPDGQLCREEKLLLMGLDMEVTKRKLSLYKCLEDSPHVPKLLGVVTDSSSRHVKSILTDTAGQFKPTPVHKLITKVKEVSQPVKLTRRLSWARQIVTGLRDLHEKGFLVGQLELSVLGVNSRSEIQILCYREKGRLSDLRYPAIAPELRGLSQDEDIQFTSRTDLFQLGLVLWQLAQHKHIREAQSELCPIEGCECLGAAYENDKHPGAIELPPMDKCIPSWYNKVVEACRSEKPGDRWAASDLLSLFPSPESLSTSSSEDTLILDQSWDVIVRCDSCATQDSIMYWCKACRHRDFSLCSICFNAGKHCTVEDHFLEESIYREEYFSWQSTGRYYSKLNQGSGGRNMLYLG